MRYMCSPLTDSLFSRFSRSSTRSAWDRTFSSAKFARRGVNPHIQLVETMMRGAIVRWGAVRQEDEDSDPLPAE